MLSEEIIFVQQELMNFLLKKICFFLLLGLIRSSVDSGSPSTAPCHNSHFDQHLYILTEAQRPSVSV